MDTEQYLLQCSDLYRANSTPVTEYCCIQFFTMFTCGYVDRFNLAPYVFYMTFNWRPRVEYHPRDFIVI